MISSKARRLGWVAIVISVVGMSLVAYFDTGGLETQGERIQRLSESFACPQCDGESVSESNAAVAATIRAFIADEVNSGQSDTEIRDDLVQAYTVRVLLNPPASGLSSLLWVLPVVAAAAGAVGFTALFDNRRTNQEVTDADRKLVASARTDRDR